MRHGSLVRRAVSLVSITVLCYVSLLISEPSRTLVSEVGDTDVISEAGNTRDLGDTEAGVTDVLPDEAGEPGDLVGGRVSHLRSVCGSLAPGPAPPGPGTETVLLPGQPPVTVCVPHKARVNILSINGNTINCFLPSLSLMYSQHIELCTRSARTPGESSAGGWASSTRSAWRHSGPRPGDRGRPGSSGRWW